MANILRLLHPFIPFFTESIWATNKYKSTFKDYLISSSWPNYKKSTKFKKNQNDINDVIELITSIRTTKEELKITPKLFCNISFPDKASKLRNLINDNINLIQQVGRVKGIIEKKQKTENSVEILVLKEKLSLSFSEDINLASQKERIIQKLDNLKKQIDRLNNKLENKAYLKNAPKEIVQNDKKLVKELTIEDDKLRSIVSSIN